MINIGPLELIVIFIVVLLVIGPKKLPELARALGRAVGEFKKATEELKTNLDIDFNSIDVSHSPSDLSSTKESSNETQKQKPDTIIDKKSK
jgi:TatA/E family protein of Tat protein translocase